MRKESAPGFCVLQIYIIAYLFISLYCVYNKDLETTQVVLTIEPICFVDKVSYSCFILTFLDTLVYSACQNFVP